jgi:hypothetical protein
VIWSLADPRRPNYDKLHQWLRLYIRMYVGMAVLSFGAAKVFPVQARDPTLSTLLTPVGDLSPLALFWNFMGSSKPYTIFAGMLEVLGASLLFVPRLTTLAGLICSGVLMNVFMLNLSYDVPVKQYSLHLLLMSVFLLIPDLSRLARLFIFNRRIEPAPAKPLFKRRWLNHALLALQLAYGGYLAATDLVQERRFFKTFADVPRTTPFYGIWNVDEFTLNGDLRPPLTTDNLRWRRVIFDRDPFDRDPEIVIQFTSGAHQLLIGEFDTARKNMKLRRSDGERVWIPEWFRGQPPPPTVAQFTLENPKPDHLILDGNIDGQRVHAVLQRTQIEFTLRKRGFHWINNRPFFGDGILI